MFANVSRKSLYQMIALTLCVFAFVGVVMMGSATTAFCDTANTAAITNAVNSITNQVYKIVRSVVVPFCIVALAFAGFQFLIGGNQGAEKARKVVIGCVCAIGFVVFAPMAVQTVSQFVASEGSGGVENYNSLVNASNAAGSN